MGQRIPAGVKSNKNHEDTLTRSAHAEAADAGHAQGGAHDLDYSVQSEQVYLNALNAAHRDSDDCKATYGQR
jgi:hypothetical protein